RTYHWYKRDYARALADYTEALRLDPQADDNMVQYRRGQAYSALKEYGKAQEDFAAALQHKPNYPNLLNSWAWQLATCPDARFRDGDKALEVATKAKDLCGGRRAEILETLAAACAEFGRFGAA